MSVQKIVSSFGQRWRIMEGNNISILNNQALLYLCTLFLSLQTRWSVLTTTSNQVDHHLLHVWKANFNSIWIVYYCNQLGSSPAATASAYDTQLVLVLVQYCRKSQDLMTLFMIKLCAFGAIFRMQHSPSSKGTILLWQCGSLVAIIINVNPQARKTKIVMHSPL